MKIPSPFHRSKEPKKCARCGNDSNLWDTIVSVRRPEIRCGSCRQEIKTLLSSFRDNLLQQASSGQLTDASKRKLWASVLSAGISKEEVTSFVHKHCVHLIERTFDTIYANGSISDEEERFLFYMARSLDMTRDYVDQLRQRVEPLKAVIKIREGFLPVISCNVHLDSGEQCHLLTNAVFIRELTNSTKHIAGQLIATDRKVLFLSDEGGWTIHYKNIMSVQRDKRSISLQLAVKKGNGQYLVNDSLTTEAILTTLTLLWKRQLLMPQSGKASRHIPQHVKNKVWLRDQGKCVECGSSSHLEFDHTIPFTKGGATSEGNLQLLCRNCNLKKRDRL